MRRRSKARIWTLQIIYAWEIGGGDLLDIAHEHLRKKRAGEKGKDYALRLIDVIRQNLETIDNLIATALTSWPIERLSIIDKNILRIGTCELLFFGEVPHAVVIDEALRLAARYGGADSVKFVNGILDAVARGRDRNGCSTG
jgi:N utilization substance protein B